MDIAGNIRNVHTAFLEQVASGPDRTAIIAGTRQWTYGELADSADVLVGFLLGLGVRAETKIGLLFDRGPASVAATIAVLKAGAAYVPLDRRAPSDRIRFVMDDCAMSVVVVQQSADAAFIRATSGGVLVVVFDGAMVRLDDEPDVPVVRPRSTLAGPPVDAAQLAYVMYTSGSTGLPKGVAVNHGNILDLARDRTLAAPLGRDTDRVLVHSSSAFDAATYEVWATLLRGGCLVIAHADLDLATLRAMITDSGVRSMWLTASLFNVLVAQDPRVFIGARQVFTGGEAASVAAFSAVALANPDLELVNAYGPTETTTFVLRHRFRSASSETVPIGVGLDGVRWSLIDDTGGPVPKGQPGELFIGGPSVCRGYHGRPALTAQRFVPDPDGLPGARMYRTGDVCVEGPDGLEFRGRRDRQVKLRGFRVELGEIEAALIDIPDIMLATVVLREDRPGIPVITAYLIASPGVCIDLATVAMRLDDRLPDYMIPGSFLVLDEFPLNINGKIDIAKLPAPVVDTEELTELLDPVDRAVSAIFGEVLGLSEVGPDDDFLALGGSSLLAVRLVGLLHSRHGVSIRVGDMMRGATVAEVAEALSESDRAAMISGVDRVVDSASRLVRRTDPATAAPLSFAQKRLWFLDQLWPGRPDYNVPIAVRLSGTFNVGAVWAAVDDVTTRHDILCTRYPVDGDQPCQVRSDAPVPRLFESTEEAVTELIHRLWAEPFTLDEAAPARVALVKLSATEHIIVLVIHHIATDGWSNELLLADLASCYAARVDGRAPELAAPPVRYADYGLWQQDQQHTAAAQQDVDYWRTQLAGLEPVTLPADRPRPPERSGRGAQRDFAIESSTRAGLARLATQAGTTVFTAMLAAFTVLVSKHSGRGDIAIGVPVTGRNRPELESVVGLFVNTVVLRSHLRPEATFCQLLGELADTAQTAYSHADVPFERVVEELHPTRDLSGNPFFQLLFAMATAKPGAGEWPDLVAQPHAVQFMAAKFDFEIGMVDHGDRITGSAYYATDLYDKESIDIMLARYVELIDRLVAEPNISLREHSVLAEHDRRLLAGIDSGLDDELDIDHVLHRLISDQAERTPDAIAVESGDRRMSYAELDISAQRFARMLAQRGVARADPVGVWCDRGPDLLVALLGVLHTGAAFVPLDPDFPLERVRLILAEAGAKCCVVDDSAAEPDGLLGVDIVAVTHDARLAPLSVVADPDDLVSVYYTSGSTGKPKGVANPHRGWVNRMRWMQQRHQLWPNEGVLHKTVLSFDDAAVELFWPLLVGGRVVMLEPGLHRDPMAIAFAAQRHEVAVVQLVPSMLMLFLDEVVDMRLPALRHVVSSGEALRPEMVARFAETLGEVGCLLHNQWGPTEASIDATIHTCSADDAARTAVPIGLPLSNYWVHVLDEFGAVVPPGVEGELYVGGVGLARCYWNDPGKTAAAFVPDPFASGERLFRTGDRAVRGRDGAITFLGRRDHQVKIRGNRVELGEVERVVAGLKGIVDAVVAVWEPRADDKRLVAYVVPQPPNQDIDVEALRMSLADKLPGYMVPSVITVLAELPSTASGKVDRNRLPEPETELNTSSRAPHTDAELLIAQAWQEFLPATDVEASFFELGGHSLLATRIITRLRRALDVELPLVLLFENPTIAGLAVAIERVLLDEPVGNPQ